MLAAPVLVSVTSFVVHTKGSKRSSLDTRRTQLIVVTVLKKDLDAETAFTALSLFAILRHPLDGLVDTAVNLLSAHSTHPFARTFCSELTPPYH